MWFLTFRAHISFKNHLMGYTNFLTEYKASDLNSLLFKEIILKIKLCMCINYIN